MPTSRAHLTIDGRRLAYLEHGPASSAKVLVWLHAFPFSADMWGPQLEASPAGWRVIAPDLRGFGDSAPDPEPPPSPVTIDDYVEDVLALLRALQVEHAVMGGLSLGGYVLFALHRRLEGTTPSPLHLDGVVLADTRAEADTVEGQAGRRQMMARVQAAGPAGVVDEMIPKLLAEESRQKPALVGQVREWILAANSGAIVAGLERMRTRPDSRAQLGRLTCPALILVGEDDALTPPVISRGMQTAMPDATLEILPLAGHLANLENPVAFGAALHRFLVEF